MLKLSIKSFGLGMLLTIFSFSFAQLSARDYYQQCLKFEAAGDYLTAQQSCINALEVDGTLLDASLALARIEVHLGRLGPAETRLKSLERQVNNPEIGLLLASIMLTTERNADAQAYLSKSERILSNNPNQQLEARLEYLKGQVAEHVGNFREALANYQNAIVLDSVTSTYPLAKAQLLFHLGEAQDSQNEIFAYQQLTGDTRNPELLSLLANTYWSQSRLADASSNFEAAISQRNSRDGQRQSKDLLSLAFTYYAQGNSEAGNLAFRDALRQGISVLDLLSGVIPWAILLVLGVGVHLWGESQILGKDGLEAIEHPEMWRIGQLYTVFLFALVTGLIVALIFSLIRYNNYLAFITPLQNTEVHAVFLICFALIVTGMSIWRAQKNGWDPVEKLLGSGQALGTGLLAGIVLLAACIAYLKYLPDSGWFGEFYLSIYRLTPLLIAAVILLPFSQLFFSSFVIPSLERRYNSTLAVIISATLFSLVLVQPLLFLLAAGIITGEIFRRTQAGINTVAMHLILNIGLLIGVSFFPFIKTLFF